MRKVEHIGIAVKDLEKANQLYTALLGLPPYKQEEVTSEGVATSFFIKGDTKIELLEATDTDSPIARFIKKKGEGLHHIAFEVNDIHAEAERLKNAGFELIGDIREGADNKLVCFIHPKSVNGVLVELCQEK